MSANGFNLPVPPELIAAIAEQVAEQLAERQPAPPEPYWDAERAARYLAYGGDQPRKWMSEFAARRGVRTYRDGRRLLFRREDLDAALRRDHER
jgi:hypothetical protein